ncbi:hypothetical protein L873DRAFT_1663931 [Choiromyces venosus 120613-1]|uniref:ARM repeat-containing protein n=1 Tax=Choiromyces venosus 120613-1 TaxID=1336337 RepID=A0A3N4K407_9PEZI|nr:hypothetical protein L873DRAFT_1663931 [Choiromyces venosus 120613-1]
MSLLTLTPSDKYLYFSAGFLAIFAFYTAHTQLIKFRSRCVSKPKVIPPDAGVDQSTEDAIHLDTLETLARGINVDIRNAALKIITDRATTDENIIHLLSQVRSPIPHQRLRSLRALRCCTYSTTLSKLCQKPTFTALVACLNSTLPTVENPSGDPFSEKEALYILARLMGLYFIAREMLVEAGFVDWLGKVQVSGYVNVVEAVFDPEGVDLVDPSLVQIVNVLEESLEARGALVEAGLMESRGVDNGPMDMTGPARLRGGSEGEQDDGQLEALVRNVFMGIGRERAGSINGVMESALDELLDDEALVMAGWDEEVLDL